MKKIVVRHFHDGNDITRAVRGPASYATFARVVDLETGESVDHAEMWAYCNPNDTPSRRQGRAIAVGRLQKEFPEACKDAIFGSLEYLRRV